MWSHDMKGTVNLDRHKNKEVGEKQTRQIQEVLFFKAYPTFERFIETSSSYTRSANMKHDCLCK